MKRSELTQLMKECGIHYGCGKITMTKTQFLKEHRNLLKVLKEADPNALQKEYEEQKKEMSKYVGKGLTGGSYSPIKITIDVPQEVWVIRDNRTGEQYSEDGNIPMFERRSQAEDFIAALVSGEMARQREELIQQGTPPRGPPPQREPPPAPRRGRGKYGLTKSQHLHLKNVLSEVKKSVDVDELLEMVNKSARKPQQKIESSSQILEYAKAKAAAPDNEHWSVAGDKYVRYTGSGLKD